VADQQPAPTTNINVPPKRKRPMWQMAALGLIVVCLVLGIIGSLAAPKTNNTTNTTAGNVAANTPTSGSNQAAATQPTDTAAAAAPAAPTNTTEPPTATAAPKVAGIGDTVTVGSWKVTVDKVAKEAEVDWSGFKNMEVAKGVFAEVFATVENTTNKSASVNSFDWKLVDSQGAEYDTCSELGCYGYPTQLKLETFNKPIPPRTAVKMLGMFDVAKDAKGLMLVIERDTKINLGDLP
jgi:hypothetical protein